MRNTLLRHVLLMAVLLAFASLALAQAEGEWWLEKRGSDAQLSFRYSYQGNGDNYSSNWSNSDDPAKLGVASVLSQKGHVNFDIVRPAGTFKCEGWMTDGKGSGHFTFAPNAQFGAELSKRGLGTPDERQYLKLAMANVQASFVDVLKQAGYSFNLDEFVRAATHGVNEQYLREMQAAGLKPASLPELVRMHDHGVSAEFIRDLDSLGYKGLEYSQYIRMADHGVKGPYVREMAAAGYKNLTPEEISRLRDHGVTADYAKQLSAAGFKDLGAQQITRMRDHGVTAEFASAVKKDAYPNITAAELVRLQDHGVTAEFVRENAKGNSVQEVIRMHDTGAKKRDML